MAFKKAERKNVWIKALLEAPSNGGKSFGALELAQGIVNKAGGRIAYIGTEKNRNDLYADKYDYDLQELEAPFEPQKYIDAIKEAIDAGYTCCIVDSLTHEWIYLNEKHDSMPGNSFQNWGKLKPIHNAFMQFILECPIHIIATARAKDEWIIEEENGKKVPKKLGLGSQQDKNISYEYHVSLMLDKDTHIFSVNKDNTGIFNNRNALLSKKDGEMLYDWATKGNSPASTTMPNVVASSAPVSNDELKDIKTQIIEKCKALGGTSNSELMTTLKGYAANGNPNSIKELSVAQELLEKLNNM